MRLLEDLLCFEGNVPVILSLWRKGGAYAKELEYDLSSHGDTVARALEHLIKKGFVEKKPYQGSTPNVKVWYVLTDKGQTIADCLVECQKKLGKIL